MDALDLTRRPPRSPRELLPGLDLLMAARTVDKIRATLPGGNLGQYQITGFSSSLLNRLGIVEGLLREAIAKAASDREVADWIVQHTSRNATPRSTHRSNVRRSAERLDDPEFLRRYPVANRLAPESSRLDLLIADDKEAFP